MRKIELKIFDSFKELRKDYDAGVRNMTPSQRLSMMENLRKEYSAVKGVRHSGQKAARKLEIKQHNKNQ
ncbi:MAG: hypothetical protein ABII64_02910 [Elusimicrobiota bacterium]